ncbi:MAG: hypothetical protein ACC634_07510, partial [Hyphomicrobiales bacterium]
IAVAAHGIDGNGNFACHTCQFPAAAGSASTDLTHPQKKPIPKTIDPVVWPIRTDAFICRNRAMGPLPS